MDPQTVFEEEATRLVWLCHWLHFVHVVSKCTLLSTQVF